MSSLYLKRACSTKQTGSAGSPSSPGSEISYWFQDRADALPEDEAVVRVRVHCHAADNASPPPTGAFRSRWCAAPTAGRSAAGASRSRRPGASDRLVGGAARLVHLALDHEPVPQPPDPSGGSVDHPADTPGVHPSGAEDAVVDLDVLLRLRAQLLPDARDVGEVRPHALVAAVGLVAAGEPARRRDEHDLGVAQREQRVDVAARERGEDLPNDLGVLCHGRSAAGVARVSATVCAARQGRCSEGSRTGSYDASRVPGTPCGAPSGWAIAAPRIFASQGTSRSRSAPTITTGMRNSGLATPTSTSRRTIPSAMAKSTEPGMGLLSPMARAA